MRPRAADLSDLSAVRLVEGDRDVVPAGTPSVASRSLMTAGSAAALAGDAVVVVDAGANGAGVA